MHVSIDGFFYLYPERIWNPTRQEDIMVTVQLVPIVVSGLHRSVAALAEAGNNVIVDHVLEEDEWLKDCVERWAGLDVLFVGGLNALYKSRNKEKPSAATEISGRPGTNMIESTLTGCMMLKWIRLSLI